MQITTDIQRNPCPLDVAAYLRDRGWMDTYRDHDYSDWYHSDRMTGQVFEWYEALVYEQFCHSTLLLSKRDTSS